MTIVESHDGTYRDHEWEIRRSDPDEITENFGDILLSIRDGSYGQYSERHDSAHCTVNDLKSRAKSLIRQICDDDNIGKCDACGGFYNRRENMELYEQELTWGDRHIFDHGMDPRYKAHSTHEESQTCVWTTGYIFDTVHIITHLKDTNLFFDDEELVNDESLVMARGYERSIEDGELRDFETVQEKYMELTRERPDGRDNREKRDALLELLDWVLKREDRFSTDRRFKYQIHR